MLNYVQYFFRKNLNAYSRHISAKNENKKYILRKQRQSLPYKSFLRFSHKSIDKKLEQFQDFLQTNFFGISTLQKFQQKFKKYIF